MEKVCAQCGGPLVGDPLDFTRPMTCPHCVPSKTPSDDLVPTLDFTSGTPPTRISEQAAAASAKERAGMALGAGFALYVAIHVGRGCMRENAINAERRERVAEQERRADAALEALHGRGFQIVPIKK